MPKTLDRSWFADLSTANKRWALRGMRVLIFAAVVWGVQATVRSAIADLGHHAWTLRPAWLVVAGVLYLAGLLPSGLFWHRILFALGQRPGLLESLRAYTIGHLGKYVPGKAMVVVLRAGLIKSQRVDVAAAVVSVFLETLTMMAVGAFLAAGVLAFNYRQHPVLLLTAVGLMVAAGLPTLPVVFRRLVRLVLARRAETLSPQALDAVGFRLMAGGWLAVAAGWCLMGLSLWATLRALGVRELDPVGQLPLYTASVALAVVAGFLSLIPGGLGVRDLILTQITAPAFGEANALIAAVLLRLVWLLSELIISGILYGFRRSSL